MRSFLFLICLFIISTNAMAQKQNRVIGVLRDSATRERIVLASVTNLNTKNTVMTSNVGVFKIELLENQILSFAAVGYHFDTVAFHKKSLQKDTLYLFLSPLAHSLGNVTVFAKGMSAYQMDSIERRTDFLQNIVNYTIPTFALSNSGAGLGISLDRYSKKEKNKRKAFAFFETNEREAYINYRFPSSIVTKYSGLKDDALQSFMQLHRPSYEWLRQHKTEEDIKYYINEKLKAFKQQ
ncbi:MAG: hypothetical protein Q8K64_10200 [Sediminibacterium sp.]|nr:MAG: hypothetical protein FD183_674 [Chitinophagaceae bacterium]MDP1843780.1 hypothetical protein [Sediminibacterium sp.]TXT34739.1 MAG: hypothetical protein FD136_154 [Chitinophagaceae bacterium]